MRRCFFRCCRSSRYTKGGIGEVADGFGSAGGVTYAVMELLEGGTLRDRLDSGPIAASRAVDLAIQIVRALAAGRLKQHEAAPLIELLGAHHRDEDPAGSR